MPAHLILLILICGLTAQAWARVSERAYKTVDLSHLRQIGQASQIYANDHDGHFPEATSAWDYARLLAEHAGFDYAKGWQSPVDPAYDETLSANVQSLLLPGDAKDERRFNPAFLQIKPVFAVALGKITTADPATTPIAWTRGLQPDGTWAAHSPYGNRGGHILFLSGKVQFFRNLTTDSGHLTRHDGSGPTTNILEALPPGTRIGEYTPTPEEQAAWSTQRRITDPIPWYRQPLTGGIAAIWTPSVLIGVVRKIRGQPITRRLVYWPAILSVILLFLLSISLC